MRVELREIAVERSGQTVLEGVNLTLQPGEVLGLIGPNGAGKSTLLKVIAGLLNPTRGELLLEGSHQDQWSLQARARRVGYLAQQADLQWPQPVRSVVSLGRLPWGSGRRPEDQQAIEQAMQATDVTHLAERPVNRLSGGERLRVLLARVLAGQPDLLLTDEPVAGLDPYHQLQVMELLQRQAQQGKAVVVVLHDLSLAARFCDRLLLLHQGKTAALGSPAAVLSPTHLANIYQVEAITFCDEAGVAVVPWRRI